MPRQMTISLTCFHSVKVQFNKSMLSTEIALNFSKLLHEYEKSPQSEPGARFSCNFVFSV